MLLESRIGQGTLHNSMQELVRLVQLELEGDMSDQRIQVLDVKVWD